MVYRSTEKTEARKAKVRENILQIGHSIVASEGFRALTMSAVAKKAEIATGTIYRYFPSKTELCVEVFRRATQWEVDKVATAANSEGTCLERISFALETFAKRAIQGNRIAYALIAEPVDPVVEEERLLYRRDYANIFEVVLQEGIQSGEFAQQEARVIAAALVGVMTETLIAPLSPDNASTYSEYKLDKQELLSSIIQFSIRAILK
ncbi:MAG: AcrR family transcriptional regulator [bacterium]|jgi:AcrR family transcriptional regulator